MACHALGFFSCDTYRSLQLPHGNQAWPTQCEFRTLASSAQACKAADELKGNLEEEYVAVRAFIVEFCRCMDHVQHAKMLVAGCALPLSPLQTLHCLTATCAGLHDPHSPDFVGGVSCTPCVKACAQLLDTEALSRLIDQELLQHSVAAVSAPAICCCALHVHEGLLHGEQGGCDGRSVLMPRAPLCMRRPLHAGRAGHHGAAA